MKSVLVTGSNRGLGLEFCRQYLAEGWRVYATCRAPDQAQELQKLRGRSANISLHPLDVGNRATIDQLAGQLPDIPLDLLINNAGVSVGDQLPFGSFAFDDWETVFRINTIGPVKMAEAFLEHLTRGTEKKLVNLSSMMGSITLGGGGACPYRASKAALNAAMNCLSGEFSSRGIAVYLLHPGWVATDMGTAAAPLSPRQSVANMRNVIASTTPGPGGRFFDHLGGKLPW